VNDQPNRHIPAHADALDHPLVNFAARLKAPGTIRIVAIGSSSTAGEGDVAPYPCRLEAALRRKYPNRMIDVLNRGIGGQEASEEFLRMRDHVIAEAPALTIWQVGTNAVWQKGHDLDDVAAAIRAGLKLLATIPTDVILMDLQYAPAVLTSDKIEATRRMLALIAGIAVASKVNVFRRFDWMRRLVEHERCSFDTLIDPGDQDRLHQSDFTARRIGDELCGAIAAAAAEAVSPSGGRRMKVPARESGSGKVSSRNCPEP
jgi:lysophospholipase L1-like esterase